MHALDRYIYAHASYLGVGSADSEQARKTPCPHLGGGIHVNEVLFVRSFDETSM